MKSVPCMCSYQVSCFSWLPLVKHADTGMLALFRMINESNKLQISSLLPRALFKRKFPTCGPGSREAQSCEEQQPLSSREPPPCRPTRSPLWEACWARQGRSPLFSPYCEWILAHPAAHARGHRILPELPYPPYSVLLSSPENGLIAFKFERESGSTEDKRFAGHWNTVLDILLA